MQFAARHTNACKGISKQAAMCSPISPLRKATAFRETRHSQQLVSLVCQATAHMNSFRQLHHTASNMHRPRGRKHVVVRANWGAPVEFTPAKVLQNEPVAPGLHAVTVDVGQLASGYTKPGQYIQIKVGDSKPGFFAIASAPDPNNQGTLELLIKKQALGSTAELLTSLPAGAEVSVSPVQGKGFPVDRLPAPQFSTILMFATGSGISPIRAVIESDMLEAKNRKNVVLYYGTKSPEFTAYHELIPQWEAAGIKVVQVFSGSNKRYVQSVLEQEEPAYVSDPKSVGVLLCGQKDMCTAVSAILAKQGVQPEQIITNF